MIVGSAITASAAPQLKCRAEYSVIDGPLPAQWLDKNLPLGFTIDVPVSAPNKFWGKSVILPKPPGSDASFPGELRIFVGSAPWFKLATGGRDSFYAITISHLRDPQSFDGSVVSYATAYLPFGASGRVEGMSFREGLGEYAVECAWRYAR